MTGAERTLLGDDRRSVGSVVRIGQVKGPSVAVQERGRYKECRASARERNRSPLRARFGQLHSGLTGRHQHS